MKQHTLSLTLATLLATAPALAADWAHNDPDKASTGKVEIWDGSKTVTIDSAPTTAVATMGGSAALGQVVTSKLTLAEFIAVNDLEAANWKDITWRSGADTVSIAGSELAEKSGKASYQKVKADGAPQVDRYYSYVPLSGDRYVYDSVYKYETVHIPPGSKVDFQQKIGWEMLERVGSRRCHKIYFNLNRSGDQAYVTLHKQWPSGRGHCAREQESFTLTITKPPAPAAPNLNYFLKINE